jgi:flagellar hook-associated protein 1
VDVLAGGTPLVTTSSCVQLEAGLTDAGELGIRQAGTGSFQTDSAGGQIGGLLALHNDLLAGAKTYLDSLANAIAGQVNRIHAQGVGSGGSMSELTGTCFTNPAAPLAAWGQGVQAGTMRVRLTAPDGTTSNYTGAGTPTTDTLATMAAKLNGLDSAHLSAAVVDGRLHLQGLAGWKFDFLPASSVATAAGWTGTAPITAAGLFQGPANDTLTCTVHGSGQVGVDEGLTVEVRNLAGQLVTTLDIGNGYVAGTGVDLHDGLTVALGAGQVQDGQTFTIDAVADADPTGFLAAAGIGTLFEGAGASNLTVRAEILDDPSLLATAAGSDLSGNAAAQRMADLGNQVLPGLGGATATDAFNLLVTRVGQQVALRQSKQDAQQNVMQMLENQRDAVSGVDINDEAAKLLVFQQMFQGMAKTLSVQQKALQDLFTIIT